ncbi:hypothetical protein PYCCODRAFT_1214483 [Trametes coccinea BRFM310]|uniref:Secreted protein n=1 Tax=Trametes coccinea (strain BRFM310) TaxID=1353009 RepID=A0A1Y2I878_TRAC3|nr:hypothetical protein PYCCODRAFT_1214483 [Trametes coccinea BRFM310]
MQMWSVARVLLSMKMTLPAAVLRTMQTIITEPFRDQARSCSTAVEYNKATATQGWCLERVGVRRVDASCV